MAWAAAVPSLATLLVALGIALFVARHGGGAALAELERANGILERRVHDLEKIKAGLDAELAVLRSRTDVAASLEPLAALLRDQHADAMRHFDHHETLLAMIADRLGPDPHDR